MVLCVFMRDVHVLCADICYTVHACMRQHVCAAVYTHDVCACAMCECAMRARVYLSLIHI